MTKFPNPAKISYDDFFEFHGFWKFRTRSSMNRLISSIIACLVSILDPSESEAMAPALFSIILDSSLSERLAVAAATLSSKDFCISKLNFPKPPHALPRGPFLRPEKGAFLLDSTEFKLCTHVGTIQDRPGRGVDRGDNSAEETWGANRKAGCRADLPPLTTPRRRGRRKTCSRQ